MTWDSVKSLTVKDAVRKGIKQKMFQNIVKRCGRFLIRLDLSFDCKDDDKFVWDENISNVIAYCTKLRSIDLGEFGINFEIIESLKPCLDNIEELRFECRNQDDEFLTKVFQQLKKLKHVKIVGEYSRLYGFTFLFELPQDRMEHLDLVHTGVDLNFIYDLSLLKSLYLTEKNVRDETLIGIASFCSELRSFGLSCKYPQFSLKYVKSFYVLCEIQY